jgi:hypothetical protein
MALRALLWAGSAVLFGAGLWQAAIVRDAEALAILPQLISGLLALGFAPVIGQLELQRPVVPDVGHVQPRGRRRVAVWIGITAVAALAHAVAASLGGVAALVVVGFLLGVAGLIASSWLLGIRSHAAARRRIAEPDANRVLLTIDLDWTAEELRLKRITVVAVVVGGLLLATVLALVIPAGDGGAMVTWLGVAQLVFIAGAGTSAFLGRDALLGTGRVVGDLSADDRAAVGRRSMGEGQHLDPELEWRAARLAAMSRLGQPFSTAQLVLVLLALIPLIVRTGAETWMLVVLGVMLAALVAVTPAIVRRQRKQRRFAQVTRDLARSYVPIPDADRSA